MELLVIIIILSLIFDYINGFHDAANSIATIVSTKVLTPFQAVIWAAFFNFVAFFIAKYIIGGFGIANTVSKTVVEQYITLPIILSGVIAAIAWNLFTWWKGIPSSSSHTLIGGFAGAAIMAHGFEAIQLNIILKIAAFIFLAPFIGMIVAFGFTLLVLHMCKRVHPHTAEVWFKKLQLVSSALFSIGHGLNDSQKVMGIIAAALIAAHSEGLGMGINSISDLPDWVAFSCFTAISLGTQINIRKRSNHLSLAQDVNRHRNLAVRSLQIIADRTRSTGSNRNQRFVTLRDSCLSLSRLSCLESRLVNHYLISTNLSCGSNLYLILGQVNLTTGLHLGFNRGHGSYLAISS